MQKLYPIANKETRHLFIDPLISRPSFVAGEGYVSGEMTSFIKPGKVPNLAELCRPENVKFTVTEEPNMETMAVTGVIFGARDDNGEWSVFHLDDLDEKLVQDGPARATLMGAIVVPQHGARDPLDYILFPEKGPLNLGICLVYERATRCLTLQVPGIAGIDSGIPQILGIKLNLDWVDSKIVK